MMKGRKLDEIECVNILSKKHDIKIHSKNREILILVGPQSTMSIGNKAWGRIDYLNNIGYRIHQVEEFPVFNKTRDL
jgi:hypothetical protein